MATITVYRYDNEDFADGHVIPPRGDSFLTLTDHQKVVERAIRSTLPDGANIRSASLYTWENQALAMRLWRFSKQKYLYELQVEDSSIRFRGDLNCYSAAVDAVARGEPLDDWVQKYCSGEDAGPSWAPPRIELLVPEAKVIKKL